MEKYRNCIIGIALSAAGYYLFKLIVLSQGEYTVFKHFFEYAGYGVPIVFSFTLILIGVAILLYDFFKNK